MQAHPHNDETPGRIDTGREFRETETGSSGNYPHGAQGGVESHDIGNPCLET